MQYKIQKNIYSFCCQPGPGWMGDGGWDVWGGWDGGGGRWQPTMMLAIIASTPNYYQNKGRFVELVATPWFVYVL